MMGMSTFAAGRMQIGSGWIGYAADVEDINGSGNPDIVAIDGNGNLWLYPNAGPSPTGGVGPSMFGAPSQVGSGWSGFQAVDLGFLSSGSNTASEADILAIDPA